MNTTHQHPAVAALVAEVEALAMRLRCLSDWLPTAAPAVRTVETIAARNARWLALHDSLPAGRGQLVNAARLIATRDGVNEGTVRKTLSEAKRARQPRYGSSPRRDPLNVWH